MSDENQTIPVRVLIGNDQPTGSGEVYCLQFSTGQRLRRALLRGGIAVCVALLFIAVPVLHFFLVPIGLIIALIVFSRAFGQKSIISHGQGKCPSCGASFKILSRANRLPFSEVCDGCHRSLVIEAMPT